MKEGWSLTMMIAFSLVSNTSRRLPFKRPEDRKDERGKLHNHQQTCASPSCNENEAITGNGNKK